MIKKGSLYHKSVNGESGFVLITGLIVLLLLTTLAISTFRITMIEEKIAGAFRNSNLSFQAAETAIRTAESFLENLTDDNTFSYSQEGFYSLVDEEPNGLFTIDWNDKNSIKIDNLEGITEPPRYMIKKLDELEAERALNITGYETSANIQTTVIFRITARSIGGNSTAQTIIRTHYAKSF
ncbi:MAG: hypothetical protein CL398_04955 [Acidiferrobacteraceae bacterium]|nr:hypothetical protein [Acidiferrobacteraceae bacterium]